MTEFIFRRLTSCEETISEAQMRRTVGTFSGVVGIFCNLLLTMMKLIAGWMTGSLAMTADAMNNLSDATGSVVTLVGFRLAGKPADPHHPYGHARMEYLSGLAVAVLILFIGLELAKTSVMKILHPEPVVFSSMAVVLLMVSIGIKLWMCLLNQSLGKKIQSKALLAAAQDSRNDCITTGAVLLSAMLGRVTNWNLDGIMGLGVAIFILYSGLQTAKETISPLLGESTDPELRQKIVDLILSQPKVLGYHDLMVHDYGPGKRFASIHVEMDKNEDPLACHHRIDKLERECLHSHNVHLVIHLDPVITDDPEQNRIRQLVSTVLKIRHPELTVHDFRRQGQTLRFDVALPGSLIGQETEIRTMLESALLELGESDWELEITFDLES